MPSYFSIVFELNKSKTAIRDFCTALVDGGLVYKGGLLEFEKDSFDEIVAWNQKKLDENFQLGFTENYSHDYKQMEFAFSDFSEVRLFILNEKESETFAYHLIVPESDLVEYVLQGQGYIPCRKNEKMELLKTLAKHMWTRVEILAIQTGWEGTLWGIKPENTLHAEPFCIIKKASVPGDLSLPFEEMERDGVLIEDSDNWNC